MVVVAFNLTTVAVSHSRLENGIYIMYVEVISRVKHNDRLPSRLRFPTTLGDRDRNATTQKSRCATRPPCTDP